MRLNRDGTKHDPMLDQSGALDDSQCPYVRDHRKRGCRCGKCLRCGFPKHSALHGPFQGELPGSKPWGHRYQPTEGVNP